jgi:hypothetical protein
MSAPYNLSNPNFGFIRQTMEMFENLDNRKCNKDSYTCPHAGCQAKWDESKKYFMCPCHGSQFDKDGKVLRGPAKDDLSC